MKPFTIFYDFFFFSIHHIFILTFHEYIFLNVQILHFILKIYLNFKLYENMLII